MNAPRAVSQRRGQRAFAAACVALLVASCATGERPAEGADHVSAVVLPFLTMVPLHVAAEHQHLLPLPGQPRAV